MHDYLAPHFERAALLIIDVQNDFVDGALPVAGTREVLPNLAKLLDAFRAARRPVAHVVRLYEPGGSDVDLVRRAEIEAGVRIVAPGSTGAEIPGALLPEGASARMEAQKLRSGRPQGIGRNEVVVYKPRWSAFYRTELERWLNSLAVDTVVVAGCNLPNCPRATLFDASERDLRTVLVEDAVSQSTAERLADLRLIGVTLLSTAAVVASIGRAAAE